MSAAGGKGGGGPKAGSGNKARSGKPRPGTGGYGRRKLEGKGPTPPAEHRKGHPAQRRAAAAAAAARGKPGSRAAARPGSQRSETVQDGAAAWTGAARPAIQERSRGAGRFATQGRGAGSAAEVVAGRNDVLESLPAAVPAPALHVW